MKFARTFLILPLSFLLLNIIEEILQYKIQREIENKYIMIACLVGAYGLGFAVVGDLLVPKAKVLTEFGHKANKKRSGTLGIILFYCAVILVIYIIYFYLYTYGPQCLLPEEWR